MSMLEELRSRGSDGSPTENVAAIRAELQETMDANAQVYRTETTLKQAEVDIARLGSATAASA